VTVQASSTPAAGLPGQELVGWAAVICSAIYLASDVVELAQGGFSVPQLVLTYVAEAAIPLVVLGLYAVQRPQIGRLGLAAAIAYAYAFIFFTATVVVALVEHSPSWVVLQEQLGPWVTVHGVVMVLAGAAFGWATVRAGRLPRWTGLALIVGVVAVAATSAMAEPWQLAAAAVRDLAIAAMGAALLTSRGGKITATGPVRLTERRPRDDVRA
jgi:hypothetical protein